MIVKEIEVYPLNLPMKASMSISGGTVGSLAEGAPHIYVKIVSDCGVAGWGEARPSHRWSYETLESVVSVIQNYLKPRLLGKLATDIVSAEKIMNQEIARGYITGQPIAKAAIDMALHDLSARSAGLSLTQLWQGSAAEKVDLTYLISTSDPAEAYEKAKDAKAAGYKGIDVKTGLNKLLDEEILVAARQGAPGLFFRADANQAYTMPEALRVAKVLEKIEADVFEQPLSAENLSAHAELRRKTSVPIALDESIWTSGGLLQAIRLEACDYAVIKVTKMGGLRGAKLCGEIARSAGVGLLGGGLTESSLAFSASSQLFYYLGIELPVDLNGPFFLADDPIANQPLIKEGTALLPHGKGIGCEVDLDKLAKYAG